MTTRDRPALALLVREGVVDAELGGLLAVLLEGGLPLVVAGSDQAERERILLALGASRPAGSPGRVTLGGPGDPDAREAARRFVAAAAEGVAVAATIAADDLEAVFATLQAPPIGLSRDELSYIGLVVVLGANGDDAATVPVRVEVVHWVRPLARDGHGHVQRLGPAVLAAWEPRDGAWEHFAWGVIAELAIRLGRRPGDLEREIAQRAEALAPRHA